MNYLWEVAIKADADKIAREDIKYRPASICRPYTEASFENLNEEQPKRPVVEAILVDG